MHRSHVPCESEIKLYIYIYGPMTILAPRRCPKRKLGAKIVAQKFHNGCIRTNIYIIILKIMGKCV